MKTQDILIQQIAQLEKQDPHWLQKERNEVAWPQGKGYRLDLATELVSLDRASLLRMIELFLTSRATS